MVMSMTSITADGTTFPQYGIYKKQNTGTKLNKRISSAHKIIPNNAFNSPNDHENCVQMHNAIRNKIVNW
jgi:hypothetical protein